MEQMQQSRIVIQYETAPNEWVQVSYVRKNESYFLDSALNRKGEKISVGELMGRNFLPREIKVFIQD